VSLGFYSIAFRIADFPRSRLASIVSEVAFPAMSSVQEQTEVLRKTYLRALSMGAIIAFPLLLGFTTLAHEFVSVVYGPKWLASVEPLRVLLPMGILLTVSQHGNSLLVAKGEPEWYFRLSLSYAASVLAFAAYGARAGITGVALGVLAATVVNFIASQIVIWLRAKVSPADTLRGIATPSLASAVMVAALLAYRAAIPFPAQSSLGLLWLAAAGAVAAVVYSLSALLTSAIRGRSIPGREEQSWQPDGERFVEQTG
jgi:O-antigen/teichoic acid export membrane protein